MELSIKHKPVATVLFTGFLITYSLFSNYFLSILKNQTNQDTEVKVYYVDGAKVGKKCSKYKDSLNRSIDLCLYIAEGSINFNFSNGSNKRFEAQTYIFLRDITDYARVANSETSKIDGRIKTSAYYSKYPRPEIFIGSAQQLNKNIEDRVKEIHKKLDSGM